MKKITQYKLSIFTAFRNHAYFTDIFFVIISNFSSGPTSAFSTYGLDKTYVDNVVVWGMPYLNTGSNYNTTTGKYYAEYNGTYLFHLNLYKGGGANAVGCILYKDSNIKTKELLSYAAVASETSNDGFYESSTTAITHLDQGDCVYVGDCNNFSNLSGRTTFTGTLISVD